MGGALDGHAKLSTIQNRFNTWSRFGQTLCGVRSLVTFFFHLFFYGDTYLSPQRPKGLTSENNECVKSELFLFLHRLQNSFFLSKSVKKSVKRGVRVLRARSARASHARRACEARASLPSLALCFQPRSRPFVWLLARTWIRKNKDCFAVYVLYFYLPQLGDNVSKWHRKASEKGYCVWESGDYE